MKQVFPGETGHRFFRHQRNFAQNLPVCLDGEGSQALALAHRRLNRGQQLYGPGDRLPESLVNEQLLFSGRHRLHGFRLP